LYPIDSGDKELLMSTMVGNGRGAMDDALAAFDEYLVRVRGVCPGTRRNYALYVGMFLDAVIAGAGGVAGEIGPCEVVEFVCGLTRRYRAATVELAASALRSFLGFLQVRGLCDGRLVDAVPMVPHRRGDLVRHLDPGQFERLVASLDSSSPRGLRDRAIILCIARLGLRASEVVRLQLEDLDWRNGVVRVRARKTGHGALLPLPEEVGSALADYLQHARATTPVREVFVTLRLRVGAPISDSIVGRAVDKAMRHTGVTAPTGGANLLRHSLATELLDRGASLGEIADVLGHRSLATTRIYAAVDLAALRQVALPWPVMS
jgi:site-specific recombinase XerD